MAKSIFSFIPEAEDLLALEPEEVAGAVLLHLHSLNSEGASLNRYSFSLRGTYSDYPVQHHSKIAEVLMEGWMWLEAKVLLRRNLGLMAIGFLLLDVERTLMMLPICALM